MQKVARRTRSAQASGRVIAFDVTSSREASECCLGEALTRPELPAPILSNTQANGHLPQMPAFAAAAAAAAAVILVHLKKILPICNPLQISPSHMTTC